MAANPVRSGSRVKDMLLNTGDADIALRQAFFLLTNYYYLLYSCSSVLTTLLRAKFATKALT